MLNNNQRLSLRRFKDYKRKLINKSLKESLIDKEDADKMLLSLKQNIRICDINDISSWQMICLGCIPVEYDRVEEVWSNYVNNEIIP